MGTGDAWNGVERRRDAVLIAEDAHRRSTITQAVVLCAVVLTVVVGVITIRASTSSTTYRAQQECASRIQADTLAALSEVVLNDTPEARHALDEARQVDPSACFR